MPGILSFINDIAENGFGSALGGILAPLGLAPDAQSSAPSGGFVGPLGNWAGNNSNALIGLGTGIAGAANGQGWGAGLQAGLQGFQSGRQADLKQQQQMAARLMAGRSPAAPSSAAYWPAA